MIFTSDTESQILQITQDDNVVNGDDQHAGANIKGHGFANENTPVWVVAQVTKRGANFGIITQINDFLDEFDPIEDVALVNTNNLDVARSHAYVQIRNSLDNASRAFV